MKEVFRWTLGKHEYEYRFTDGVCEGFFADGEEDHMAQEYKGRKLTDTWRENMKIAGFMPVPPNLQEN